MFPCRAEGNPKSQSRPVKLKRKILCSRTSTRLCLWTMVWRLCMFWICHVMVEFSMALPQATSYFYFLAPCRPMCTQVIMIVGCYSNTLYILYKDQVLRHIRRETHRYTETYIIYNRIIIGFQRLLGLLIWLKLEILRAVWNLPTVYQSHVIIVVSNNESFECDFWVIEHVIFLEP